MIKRHLIKGLPAVLGLCLCALAMGATASTDTAPLPPAKTTFYKDVLPILQNNCQSCHRPGEVAPMSLLTYEDARPWAVAIKMAVLTKKMPTWYADPQYGHFSNERKLTPQIGQVFPFERALEAYKLLEQGKNYGKVILKIAA